VQGMEKDFSLAEWTREQWSRLEAYCFNKPLSPEEHELKVYSCLGKPLLSEEHELFLALQPEEYNNNDCLLTRLPNETLIDILSHCLIKDENSKKSLKYSIKEFMQLSTTCKNFNRILTFETIGTLCKKYAQGDKNRVLQNLVNDGRYATTRLPILILICAGADANTRENTHTRKDAHDEMCIRGTWLRDGNQIVKVNISTMQQPSKVNNKINGKSLLGNAIFNNDAELATTLFRHHANPKVRNGFSPLFFYAKTVEIAQMFIDNGVNLRATDIRGNVLWHIVINHYPSDLMLLYLKHNVDPKKLSQLDGSCLLYALAKQKRTNNTDDFLKKGELLLAAIPDMVNALNKDGKTPVDIAQESLETLQPGSETYKAFEALITLFKERGGKTAQELAQHAVTLEQIDQ